MIWHSSEIKDILEELNVDINKGLSNGVADERLEIYGKNAIRNVEKPSFYKCFLSQLKSKTVYLLFIIAVICFVISVAYKQTDFYSPILIIAIVLLNAVISAFHLFKSESALNELKSITNPTATVLRDGVKKYVPSDELVPGDVILISEGDYISADARIIEDNALRCNESVLTGNNIPVEKNSLLITEDIAPIEKRANMVYSGSSVVHGSAKAIVVETGLNTVCGKNEALTEQIGSEALPMQEKLDSAGKIVNIIICIICVLTFIIGFIQNFSTSQPFAAVTVNALLNSVALAVAAIPEGLPTISTIVIALGIQRIITDNIIIKKTSAVEVLGKTSVICSDKTGVLTHNKMSLNCIYDGNELTFLEDDKISEKNSVIVRLAATCSTLVDDPTEAAIESANQKINSVSKAELDNLFPRLSVIPFDSQRKTMTSINMINGKPMAIIKGAPETVIEKCVGIDKEKILKFNNDMTNDSLRVICIAIKPLDEIPANPSFEAIENDLTFVGLLGLIDPPRKHSVDGIKICKDAGIKTIMITGDNILTAKAIAKRIGILSDDSQAITGAELCEMTDTELKTYIDKYSVFARVSPEDKVRIIKAWQARGETVTITGDSAEDSQALLTADIGCAIGKKGVDIAKGSADIIITESSFISIVNAIRESRGLFDNIKKAVSYLLSCNFAELLIFVLGMLIFKHPPLAAVQLLWINLLTDCAPAIALSMEKAEDKVMDYYASKSLNRIFDKRSFLTIALQSLFITVLTLLAFNAGNKTDYSTALTMSFATLGLSQIFHSFNIKTRSTVLKTDFKSNEFMNYSAVVTLFIIIFLCLTPSGALFGLTVLSAKNFFTSLLLAFLIVPLCEIIKLVKLFIDKGRRI